MIAYTIFHTGFHTLYLILAATRKDLIRYIIPFYIFLFSGLRKNVGNDFNTYYNHFLEKKYKPWEISQGFLFEVSELLGGFEWYILITSAIIVFGYSRFINDFSKNRYLSYTVFITLGYFLMGSFNLIRQYISISLFLYSLTLLNSKNNLKYLAINILGCSFHLSSLIAIGIFPFLKKGLNIKNIIPITIIGLTILNFTIDFLLTTLGLDIYLNEEWQKTMNNERNLFFVYFYFLMVGIGYYHFHSQNDNYNTILKSMTLISSLLILSAFYVFPEIPNMFFLRINNYFLPVILILVGGLTNYTNKFIKLMYIFTVLTGSYSYLIYTLIQKGTLIKLLPYNTIWN